MQRPVAYRSEQLDMRPPSTSVGIARKCGKWRELPYLRDNEGMLPPCMIAVGDRRRVASGAKLLREPVLLHEALEKVVGTHGRGRVDVAVGIFEHEGKPLPVTLLETGVGCSAQELYGLEGLLLSRHDGYLLDGIKLPATEIVILRVGMCRGIIIGEGDHQKEPPFIRPGDMIITECSLDDGLVARQRLGLGSSMDISTMRRFWDAWTTGLGLRVSEDNRWPVLDSTPAVVTALMKSCSALGLERHLGSNLSKASINLEQHAEELVRLRKKHNVLSTEMDHFCLALLAHELTRQGIATSNGLVSCVAGTVPGTSHPEQGSLEENALLRKETGMMHAALLALWEIFYGKNSNPGRSSGSIPP